MYKESYKDKQKPITYREAIRKHLPRLVNGEIDRAEFQLNIEFETNNAPYWVNER